MKYKFGEAVSVDHEFYGEIEGTIQDYNVVSEGFWPFKKRYTVYSILCQELESEDGYGFVNLIVAEEKYIKAKKLPSKLVPVK